MDRENEDNSTGEIEITPAMISAGVSAFHRINLRLESEEEAVERIYTAMAMVATNERR